MNRNTVLLILVFLINGCSLTSYNKNARHIDPSLPPLLKGLPLGHENGNQEFSLRLKKNFTENLNESFFIRRLKNEGFTVLSSDTAIFREQSLPCPSAWKICWTKDKNSYVHEITGYYGTSCL